MNKHFQSLQREFADYLRDPENNPVPTNASEKGLAIYRQLFINNISNLISSSFPVLRSLYQDAQWSQLMRAFFSSHSSHSPYFIEISKEFIHFVENTYQPLPSDPPYMLELAHYEWVEIALSIQHEQTTTPYHPISNILDDHLVISSLAWRLCYEWPVHRISASYIPEQPSAQPIWLIVYQKKDQTIGFIEINQLTALLLEQIDQNPSLSVYQLLTKDSNYDTALISGAKEILQKLYSRRIILGATT